MARFIRTCVITGLGTDPTMLDVEDNIDQSGQGQDFEYVWFDETDGSWDNFSRSPNIRFVTSKPRSDNGTSDYAVSTPTNHMDFSKLINKKFYFVADVNNVEGDTTLNVDGLGGREVVAADGSDLADDVIKAGFVITVRYNDLADVFFYEGSTQDANMTNAKPNRFFSTTCNRWLIVINSNLNLRLTYLTQN